jgi:GNAT superfamily N-acetyltransferase
MTGDEALVVRVAATADEIPCVERMWEALYELQRLQGMQMAVLPGVFALWLSSMRPTLGRFAQLFLAEASGVPVGFLTARVRSAPPWFGGATVGFVSEVWVDPDARGHGLGGRLVLAAEDWFRERGIERAELQVMATNEPARRLYRRLGWHDELLQLTRRLS